MIPNGYPMDTHWESQRKKKHLTSHFRKWNAPACNSFISKMPHSMLCSVRVPPHSLKKSLRGLYYYTFIECLLFLRGMML
jgi:hypothetical protein